MRNTALRPNFNKSRMLRLLLTALATTLLVAIATGCGSNKTSSATPSKTSSETSAAAAGATPAEASKTGGASAVNGVMKEFSITSDKTVVAAGNVKFTIANKGKMTHEFIVVKTDLAVNKLPMSKVPGATNKVDEDAHSLSFIGEIEHLLPGETDTKTFKLEPGNYVLFCNVAGHYSAGQRIALKVQ